MPADLELDDDLPPEVAAAVGWHDLAAGETATTVDQLHNIVAAGAPMLAARAVRQACTVADSGGIGILAVPVGWRYYLDETSPAWDHVADRCLEAAERPDGTLELCLLRVADHPPACPLDRPNPQTRPW